MSRVEKNAYLYWIIKEKEANERYIKYCHKQIDKLGMNEDGTRWIKDIKISQAICNTLDYIETKAKEESIEII